MKVEVKKLDGAKRELDIQVEGDIVKNKFEEVFKKIASEAKVPGFRPGHAPRDILEKQYSAFAHEQVLKELIPDVYNQAIKSESLDVIELPNISEVKLERESLSFKAQVELNPEIELKNYKGIKVEYKKISVASDEIKRNIDSFKESRKAEKLDDAFAKSLGYLNVSELEQIIEKQIFLQKSGSQRQKIENDIIDFLTKGQDLKLPQSMVNRQLQELVRQAKIDLALKGVQREKLDEQEKAMAAELEPQARQQIKVYLVLSAIAKKENIPLDDHMPQQVMEFLLREADWKEAV